MITKIVLGAVFGVLVFFALYKFLLTAPSSDSVIRMFVIQKGESSSSIAERLEKEGFIRNSRAFKFYLWRHGLSGNIQAGDFKLKKNEDAFSLVQNLTHGTIDRWVTIIEGWRAEEVAEYLKEALPETADYLDGKSYKIDPYLAAAIGHEGYLFPDTYLIPKDASAEAVISILLNNFEKKFDKNLEEDAQKAGLTKEKTMILASIVEREARFEKDRPLVAGVLQKRLFIGMPLQADATVQYALGYQKDGKTWWKKQLTAKDLQVNSSYNTYKIAGLPPTPISNPGLASTKAVVYAPKTDYLFYISDKDGNMHYAKTLEEHNENISKFLK